MPMSVDEFPGLSRRHRVTVKLAKDINLVSTQ
jgi:hypothetical protein